MTLEFKTDEEVENAIGYFIKIFREVYPISAEDCGGKNRADDLTEYKGLEK